MDPTGSTDPLLNIDTAQNCSPVLDASVPGYVQGRLGSCLRFRGASLFELLCDAAISTPWGGRRGLGRESCQSKEFRDHLISSLYSVAIINYGLMREVDISQGTAREWQSQKCRASPVASHPCIPPSTSPGITQACSLNFSLEKWA